MKFALAGNPNSGKTTLFNALTGSTAHVGNWPGVTVDKKVGAYKKLEERIDIVDLPGIYSLSPYTAEEVVARNYVLDESPDCVINIVDATNLERNLYLTTQLLELDTPIVIALNMMDIVKKDGDQINIIKLEKALGVPVVDICALKCNGIENLMQIANMAAKKGRKGTSVLINNNIIGELYNKVFDIYKKDYSNNIVFHTVKIIENDELEVKKNPDIAKMCDKLKKDINTGLFEGDYEGVVADSRYKYICKHYATALKKNKSNNGLSKSDKIDRVMTHRIWGIPIFLFIMFLVFHLTFSENLLFLGGAIAKGSFNIPIIGTDAINSPGVMLFNCIDWLNGVIGDAIRGALTEGTWYTGLICDGLLEGIFAVISFIPQIMCLFFFLSILEDTGYMARVAFIMDRAFRKFGLSGKAFMPLLMCFGCAVPGIMATRTLANEAERKRTIMLTPFFSCGAKLPIWAAFAGVFAHVYTGMNSELIVYGMYLLGIVVAVFAALFLKKTSIKGEAPPFIMELPNYHIPQPKNLIIHLWDKLKHYIYKVTTVIAGAVVVLWFLSSFNFSFHMVADSGQSIIGIIAKGITWMFVPLGFGMGENGWQFVVAAFTGLIAKEMVVATMGTFSGMSGEDLNASGSELADAPLGLMLLGIGGALGGVNIAIPAMFSFMAFNLLSVPCMAAVAAANGELNSKKSMWQAIGFWMLTASLVSLFIFWYGVLITVCWWAALLVGIVLVGLLVLSIYLSNKKETIKISNKQTIKSV